ncbi:MAG: hypothetical protein ABWK53_07305 [Anaerolineales bacterium]
MSQVLEWLASHPWVILLLGGVVVALGGSAAAYFLWRGLRPGGRQPQSRLSPPTHPAPTQSPPKSASRHEAPTVPPEKPVIAAGATSAADDEPPAMDDEMQELLAKLETYSATLAEDEILPLARGGRISKDAIRRMIKRLESLDEKSAEGAGEE